jgi:hypothetical protein
MSCSGGGLHISEECMVLGYEFWIWFSTRAIINIICLKNFIRVYWVTYDSKRQTAFIVHQEVFGLLNMIFDMHPCGLHIYYPMKTDMQYDFVQTVVENMKLFTKRQIEGMLKAHHLDKMRANPSNANFKAVLQVGGIGSCTVTVDNAKVS